ncbi:MAG: hypothetical protein J2P30_06945, partial [Actinobacteria bacterium]|nr:hypothetical protein [Actinomycetota bacterium]
MSLALPDVLAIDGGNSKTDLALVAADGSLLATARGPGMACADRLPEWVDAVAGLVAEVRRQAGMHGNPVARHISACVANVDLPEEAERTAAALLSRGWSATTEAVNDTFAVLRAGLDGTAAADAEPGPVPPGRHWGV